MNWQESWRLVRRLQPESAHFMKVTAVLPYVLGKENLPSCWEADKYVSAALAFSLLKAQHAFIMASTAERTIAHDSGEGVVGDVFQDMPSLLATGASVSAFWRSANTFTCTRRSML